jgi:hypothetical protein
MILSPRQNDIGLFVAVAVFVKAVNGTSGLHGGISVTVDKQSAAFACNVGWPGSVSDVAALRKSNSGGIANANELVAPSGASKDFRRRLYGAM